MESRSQKSNKVDFYVKRTKNQEAVILYSGGTTGDPKGVVLSNLNFNALGMQSFKMTNAKVIVSISVLLTWGKKYCTLV